MDMNKPVDIGGLGYPQLHSMITEAQADLAGAKAWLQKLNDELEARLGPSVRAALNQQGKDTGTVTLDIQGGLKAKGVIDKKVEWDSEKLLALAQTMPWERVRELFKIAFAVPERVYTGIRIANPELCQQIDAARTTKTGAPKITLAKEA